MEQPALISGGYQRTFCSIIFTTIFRGDDRLIFRKPRITTLDVDRQLLIQNGSLSCRVVLLSSTYMCFRQYLAFDGFLHRIFEGHRKEDVTNEVSNPPFNLVQRSDSGEEPMLIG